MDLNSRLLYSTTAVDYLSEDLRKTYKDYELSLQVHGQPVARLRVDPEEYVDQGIAVNSEFILALKYHARNDGTTESCSEKVAMLFAPLGELPFYSPTYVCRLISVYKATSSFDQKSQANFSSVDWC